MILLLMLYVVVGIIWTSHCLRMELERNKAARADEWIFGIIINFLFWPGSMWLAKKKYGKLGL